MISSDYFLITAEIESAGELQTVNLEGLHALPAVGDRVVLEYLREVKVAFTVTEVEHHLSSIGHNLLQQVTIRGKATA